MTRAEALIALVGASDTSVLVLDLTEALFFMSGIGIGIELRTSASNPTIAFLLHSSPFSHLIESGNWLFAVWTILWTNMNSTWTIAIDVSGISTFEWLVAVLDRGSQSTVFVTGSLPVLFSLLEGSLSSGSKLSLEIWIVVQIFLSLLGGQLLGACSKSTLLNTDSGIVGLWVEHGINVVVTSSVAFGILIIEGLGGRWSLDLWLVGVDLALHLVHSGVGWRSLGLFLFLIIILSSLHGVDL